MNFVRGAATGLEIPAHAAALRAGGATLLTRAFRAFGSLSAANQVTRVTRCDSCPGGSTGQKVFLSVEYASAEPGLHTDLFVKFSRDFADPIRDDRGKYEMESEIDLAAISRSPAFPIHVPRVYFADYDHESHTGLIVSQRIAFGADGIEPHRSKCLDHLMTDPLPYYRTIVKALARIAAAHKSGRLGAEVACRFPYDPAVAAAASPISYDAGQLHDLVRQYADFVEKCPQLLPARLASAEFIEKLDREAGLFLEHEARIERFLQSNPQLIALCHWNAQIDNAWFWRDSLGELQCGLMDWGRVGQMNVAFSLWGSLSGTTLDIWDHHLNDLLTLFAEELAGNGGPRIEVRELELHLLLYAALMALCYFLASPSRILFRLPEAIHASGPLDPMFLDSDPARNNLHMLTVALSLWQAKDFGALLKRITDRPARGTAAR